jgi:hypothetical protein
LLVLAGSGGAIDARERGPEGVAEETGTSSYTSPVGRSDRDFMSSRVRYPLCSRALR